MLPRHDASSGRLVVQDVGGEVSGRAARRVCGLDLDLEWYLLARRCMLTLFQFLSALASRELLGITRHDTGLIEL